MIDNLISKIESLKAPIVVGLDPTPELMPARLQTDDCPQDRAEAIVEFNCEIIDAIHDLVPAVKPQIAMYERYGMAGLDAYITTTQYAKSKGLMIIGDIKRGDIASTAEAYACHIGNDKWAQDAVTLNPYLGKDSVAPFLKVCGEQDKGVFVLVKTSNAGSSDLQDLPLENGKLVYEHVADSVSDWGKDLIGASGYSKVGAVVGATFPEQGRKLRGRMPHTFFLVPGYGAQGGSGKDLQGFFDKNGIGCIVNSSRGIIAAWKKDEKFGENNIGDAAREAVLAMKADLMEAV